MAVQGSCSGVRSIFLSARALSLSLSLSLFETQIYVLLLGCCSYAELGDEAEFERITGVMDQLEKRDQLVLKLEATTKLQVREGGKATCLCGGKYCLSSLCSSWRP